LNFAHTSFLSGIIAIRQLSKERKSVSTNVAMTAVIPSYNRADLISETVTSALNQTRPFAEIIVVDDASTDATLEKLREFGEKITVIASAKVGVQLARNKGVNASTSPYVTLCDSDDLLLPTYVENISDWLSQHPECDSIYSNFVTFGAQGTSPDKFSSVPKGYFDGSIKSGSFLSKVPDLYGKTVGFQPLFSSGVTIKKNFYQSLGGYNPAFNGIGSEDWEYTLRAIAAGDIALCTTPLVKIRRHDGNDSRDKVRQLLGEVTVLEHALACHTQATKYSQTILEGMNSRRIDAFELAFGSKQYHAATTILPLITKRPTSGKFFIKACITEMVAMGKSVRRASNRKEKAATAE
jgi:glycosyltransferase involved in cell wall biosynthesis